MKTVYIPLKSMNLAHYFAMACIAPASFIENRNPDIQTAWGSCLLVSFEKRISNNNCSLEVSLTDDEFNSLEPIYVSQCLLMQPLPISRIKKVIFFDEITAKKSAYNINLGAGFIPQDLIYVEDVENHNPIQLDKTPYIKRDVFIDWSEKLAQFNSILGGFAMLKAFGKTQGNFLGALSVYNTDIKSYYDNNPEYTQDNNDDWLDWAFTVPEDTFYQESHPLNKMKAKVDNSIINEVAKSENITITNKFGKIDLNAIDPNSMTYLYATVASYGPDARLKLDDLISDLSSGKLAKSKAQGVSLCFGVNKGYSVFRNKYKTDKMDLDIKFTFNPLELYAIESMFEYVFKGKTDSGSFSHIDN